MNNNQVRTVANFEILQVAERGVGHNKENRVLNSERTKSTMQKHHIERNLGGR